MTTILEPLLTSQEIVAEFPDFDLPFGKGFLKKWGSVPLKSTYTPGEVLEVLIEFKWTPDS